MYLSSLQTCITDGGAELTKRKKEVRSEKELKPVTHIQCSWIFIFSKYHTWKPSLRPQERNRFNFAHASPFLYISLPSLHDYGMKVPIFMICEGRKHKTMTFFFFSWTSIKSLKFNSRKNLLTFDYLNEMDKFEAVRIHF